LPLDYHLLYNFMNNRQALRTTKHLLLELDIIMHVLV
jgi:hypothetical protein